MSEVTKDAQDNKVVAILAYFGILFLVPLLAAKNSPFARFHAIQGLTLFAVTIVLYIVYFLLLSISLTIGTIFGIVFIGVMILAIIGIINAAKGQMKELPLIGGIKLMK